MMAVGQLPEWFLAIVMFSLGGYFIYQLPKQKEEARPAVRVTIGFAFVSGLLMLVSLLEGTDDFVDLIVPWLLFGYFGTLITMIALRYRKLSPEKQAAFHYLLRMFGWVFAGFLVIVLLLKLFE